MHASAMRNCGRGGCLRSAFSSTGGRSTAIHACPDVRRGDLRRHLVPRYRRRRPHDHRADTTRPRTDVARALPAGVMDHYVALARDADAAHVQQLSDEIATRKRT